ncbi:hypothetical protein PR002_g21125 [Phytophthora rubi]|uniref:Secreted protein n=1 Tax=Phytophthora rubi TaxID=129364 RepID=A0A6A3JDS6_9STRA|nr:hypothetical protein PR002_g21125 [Phytophthora rubi]
MESSSWVGRWVIAWVLNGSSSAASSRSCWCMDQGPRRTSTKRPRRTGSWPRWRCSCLRSTRAALWLSSEAATCSSATILGRRRELQPICRTTRRISSMLPVLGKK